MKLQSLRWALMALVFFVGQAIAAPDRLSNSQVPMATVRGASLAQVQGAILSAMIPTTGTPVRQGRDSIVFEFPLTAGQAFLVNMFQGNGTGQAPVGRQTFNLVQAGPDVIVTAKAETVAGYNAVVVDSPVTYNELFLQLQLIAATVEGRYVPGPHNMLGIKSYKKPNRKTKKVGIEIEAVQAGGPAEKAGLAPGDIITRIGGVPTAEQSTEVIGLLGFLQSDKAVLQVEGKGEVVVVKAPRPTAAAVSVGGQPAR